MIYKFNGYIPVVDQSSFVHPMASVTGNVIVGKNVYIGPGAAIRGDWGAIIIKDGCNVQENCTIHMFPGKTVILEEAAHIGHGAIIHGAYIGRNVLVGMNSVIMDEVIIGDECIIGALTFIKAGTIIELSLIHILSGLINYYHKFENGSIRYVWNSVGCISIWTLSWC